MKISIITIAYNSASTIEDTIKSVVSQTYTNIEYIIVDGNSTDGTVAIIDKYSDNISTFISEPDKGIYDAMNKGVRLATGDFIGILNSDDFYINESVIERVVQQLTISKSQSLYADLVYVDREDTFNIKRYWNSGGYKRKNWLKGWMPPHPTFFLKKKCYENFGLYSTELKSASDYELMLRMLYKHGVSTSYLPEVITKMRVGGESNVSLKNRIRANKEDRKAWQMNQLTPGAFTFIRKPLGKVKQFLIKPKK